MFNLGALGGECHPDTGRRSLSLRLAIGHLDPVQLLFDLVKGVVADLVGGTHRENSLPCCLEGAAMKLAM